MSFHEQFQKLLTSLERHKIDYRAKVNYAVETAKLEKLYRDDEDIPRLLGDIGIFSQNPSGILKLSRDTYDILKDSGKYRGRYAESLVSSDREFSFSDFSPYSKDLPRVVKVTNKSGHHVNFKLHTMSIKLGDLSDVEGSLDEHGPVFFLYMTPRTRDFNLSPFDYFPKQTKEDLVKEQIEKLRPVIEEFDYTFYSES